MIYFRVGRIEYYTRDGRFVRLADVPSPSDAFVSDSDGGFRAAREREYYRACVVDGDRLIAAFSGRSGAAYEGQERSAAEFLHVFNWDGELTEVYHLDPPVHAIDVSPDGTVMYGASLIDATIYSYPLPQ